MSRFTSKARGNNVSLKAKAKQDISQCLVQKIRALESH